MFSNKRPRVGNTGRGYKPSVRLKDSEIPLLSPIVGWYAKTNVEVKHLILKACLLPVLDYGIVQLLPRVSKTNLRAIERQYRMALKTAAELPRDFPTSGLWEMLDEDPWHLRVHDLHYDMLAKLNSVCLEGLDEPGPAYKRYGQNNPMLSSSRIGDIEYVPKKERSKPVHKRSVPPRQPRL